MMLLIKPNPKKHQKIKKIRARIYHCKGKKLFFQNLFLKVNTVIPSNFRKTLTKDRIVSYRIFFKNTEKETANQTFEFISNKNRK